MEEDEARSLQWRLPPVCYVRLQQASSQSHRQYCAHTTLLLPTLSGWEEQLEMLEPDARAGAPVDPEALVAMKKSFDIVQHVNIHEDIPGLLRVLMRHASGRRVARARQKPAWVLPSAPH